MSNYCSVVDSDGSGNAMQCSAQDETADVCVRLTANVAVESRAGIVLIVDNAAAFFIGQKVRVTYMGSPKAAFVRRIVERDDGKTNIGLEWKTMRCD